jgi:hemerythrin-like domain-containing protein
MNLKPERRTFLLQSSALALSTLALPRPFTAQERAPATPAEDDVSTNEDLMREHGVLNRILLIYDEAIRRIRAGGKFDPAILGRSAALIQKFIEDYHEKLEEDHLFPRFEKAGKLVDLVKTLRAQHAAGRTLTGRILAGAKSGDLQSIRGDLAAFVRMYRPHEAREDTVLFPALHSIVTKHEYAALGEEFDRIEQKTFGGDGFDMAVDQVTALEKQLGLYDLTQFTPK